MLCDNADMPTIIIQVLYMEDFVKEIKIHMLMLTCWQIKFIYSSYGTVFEYVEELYVTKCYVMMPTCW